MARKLFVFVLVFLGAGIGPVTAGIFPDLDAQIAVAKTREIAADQRIRTQAEMDKANEEVKKYSYQIAHLDVALIGARYASKLAKERQDRLCRVPLNMTVLLPVNIVKAAYDGFAYSTDSPVEYFLVHRLCRGVNAVKNTIFDSTLGGLAQSFFLDSDVTPIPGGENGFLTRRGIRRGPVAQVFETAAAAVAPALGGSGVIAPFEGVDYAGSIAIEAIIGTVGSLGIGETAGMAEKELFK